MRLSQTPGLPCTPAHDTSRPAPQSVLNWVGLTIFIGAIIAYAIMAFQAKTKPKTLPIKRERVAAKVGSAVGKFKKASTERSPLTGKGSE
jgi:hypothetical protein